MVIKLNITAKPEFHEEILDKIENLIYDFDSIDDKIILKLNPDNLNKVKEELSECIVFEIIH